MILQLLSVISKEDVKYLTISTKKTGAADLLRQMKF